MHQMYTSQLFIESKSALENSGGLKQAFNLLPRGAEISVILDKRIPCALVLNDNFELLLEPRKANKPDFEFIIYPELIRILKSNKLNDLFSFYKEFAAAHFSGNLQFSILCPIGDLYKKGYLSSLKKLPKELQGEFMNYFFKLAMTVNQSIENVRKIFKK